jgi:hypothetical protein
MKRLQFAKLNKILIGISFIMLLIGYGLMATGDSVFSPIILTITYVCLIPFSILYKPKQ